MKNLINKLNNDIEKIVFVLFCLFVIMLSFFHEPWFDELQAFEISKDSLYNILFVIPHYEGHPPLWHLILKCFSIFNISPELGVRIPNLLFMFGAVWLLIFKSPFPKTVRLALPFTYFIFYQYSIISRPYSIFCFALMLCALFYKTRNENPLKFVGSLILLSLSTAYGMFLTAGITIAWGIEVLKSLGIKEFIRDKKFHLMLSLFFISLLLAFEISPKDDVMAFFDVFSIDYVVKFFYSFFVLVADATVWDFFNDININIFYIDIKDFFKFYSDTLYNNMVISFWGACIIGLLINIFLFSLTKSMKKQLFFFIPYILFLLMAFAIYIKPHHIGLLSIFFIFAFWCIFSNEEKLDNNLKKILSVLVTLFLIVQIYWSFSSALQEIKSSYAPSRDVVSFIKQHKMTEYKLMCSSTTLASAYANKKTGKLYVGEAIDTPEKYKKFIQDYELRSGINLLSQLDGTVINSYFGKNIFYNFNLNFSDKTYTIHKKLSDEESMELIQKWEKLGLPDFIVGNVDVNSIFKNEENPSENYLLLKEFKSGFIWKDKYILTVLPIYINKNLF